MEGLMRQDEIFVRKLEAAEERQTKRIAEMLERRDQAAAQWAARRAARGQPDGQDPREHSEPNRKSKRETQTGASSSTDPTGGGGHLI